jgi:ubiquinone/menaquinone biosynthesis C-methylase UbiE
MLEVARMKFAGDEAVLFEAVDATQLPYPDNSFDLIACQFGVMFFPDKARHFSESLRVLKPGGRYLFNVWGPWADNRFAELSYEVTRRKFPENPPEFYKVPFSYNDPAEIERALNLAGFAPIDIEEVRFSNPIKSVEDFSQGLIFGNPGSAEIEARGGNCEDIRMQLELDLRQQLDGKLELMALVTTASKL